MSEGVRERGRGSERGSWEAREEDGKGARERESEGAREGARERGREEGIEHNKTGHQFGLGSFLKSK